MRKSLIVTLAGLSLALIHLQTRETLIAQGAPPAGSQAQPAQGQGQRGGQRGGRGQQPAVPSKPTPRRPDGRPILGALPEDRGIWGACCGSLSNEKTPFQPWAKALLDYRRANEFEPHTRCKPSGGARQFVTPYGTEILEFPEMQRIYIFDIGGPHTFRTIYMDGRPHPKDLVPSYYGHSTGRWEGDTLVIDTTGFNEGFWMDRAGSPHTEKLRFVERLTRTDYNTMRYEVTVDDPGAYTEPWTTNAFQLRWNSGQELFEYVCQDNNFAYTLLIGSESSIDRSSAIVP